MRITFSAKQGDPIPGYNVVGSIGDPAKQPAVVVCAHRDSIARDGGQIVPAAGAIDNASGTTALIEIARQLASETGFEGAAVFLSADGEEVGLTGSREFAQNLPFKNSNLAYLINMDCIAARGSATVELYATRGSEVAEAVRDLIASHLTAAGFDVAISEEDYPSDQRSFEEIGSPAVVIHTTREAYSSHIHTPRDVPDNVDPEALAAIVRAVTAAIVKHAAAE